MFLTALKKTIFLLLLWPIGILAQGQDFYTFIDSLLSDEIPKITVKELGKKKILFF